VTTKKTSVKEKKENDDIITRLNIIIKLLANNVTRDKNATEASAYLRKIGFSNKEIAETLNLKQNVVAAMLSNVKKAKSKKEKPNE
jgi:hypothetical protein